jgi:hypothetical protein
MPWICRVEEGRGENALKNPALQSGVFQSGRINP